MGKYLNERFNGWIMIPICGLFAAASAPAAKPATWLVTTALLYLYLLQLRLTDEFKDREHDKKFYPDRPVPRGLVTLEELKKFAVVVVGTEIVLALAGKADMRLFIVLEGYSLLMLKEFFCKKWLTKHFTAYVVSHEISMIPLFAFLMTVGGNKPTWPGILFLGFNLFALEMARKIRPKARLGGGDTYIENYGFRGAVILSLSVLAAAAVVMPKTIMAEVLLGTGILMTTLGYVGLR